MSTIARAALIASLVAPTLARAEPADYRGDACAPRLDAMKRRFAAAGEANRRFLDAAAGLRSDVVDGDGERAPGTVAVSVDPAVDDPLIRRNEGVVVAIDQHDLTVTPARWVAQTVAAVRRRHPRAIELSLGDVDVARVKPLLVALSALAPIHVMVMHPAPSPIPDLIGELPAPARAAADAVPERDTHAVHDALRAQFGACDALTATFHEVETNEAESKLGSMFRGVPRALARCGCAVPDLDLFEALLLRVADVPGYQPGWLEVRFDAAGAALGAPADSPIALVRALAALPRDVRGRGVALP